MEAERSIGDITMILRELPGSIEATEREALYNRLFLLLYTDLRHRARIQIGAQARWDTLRPTALVHEAWEKLLLYDVPLDSREHFLNVAAKTMRSLIVDRARQRRALKRGAENVWNFGDDIPAVRIAETDPDTIIWLNEALDFLTDEQVRLVELRFFTGHSYEEVGNIMAIEPEAVRTRWKVIKLLLYDRLTRKSHAAG